MARTSPTEESLGLTPTEDELATASTPAEDGDIPIDDGDTPVVEATQVKVPEDKPAEAPVDPTVDATAKPEDPKTVDLRALQEARAEAREAKQRNALLEQRTNEILAAFTAQQQAAAQQYQEPVRERPVGDPLALLEYLAEKVDRQEMTAAQARQMAEQEGYRRQALTQIHNMEVEFKQSVPDYDAAINHLRETRHRELEIMFPLSNAQQRNEYIAQEWQQIVDQSAQAGLNPVQQVYNLAKARGFTAQQASALANAQQQIPPQRPDLAAVAAAQQRHQSLSDAPGGETVAPLDAKALARMSDKEFKAWMSKKGNEAKFDEIMGR